MLYNDRGYYIMKKVYDLMLCEDGVSRAVEIVNGVLVDPSIGKPKVEEKVEEEQEIKLVLPAPDGADITHNFLNISQIHLLILDLTLSKYFLIKVQNSLHLILFL